MEHLLRRGLIWCELYFRAIIRKLNWNLICFQLLWKIKTNLTIHATLGLIKYEGQTWGAKLRSKIERDMLNMMWIQWPKTEIMWIFWNLLGNILWNHIKWIYFWRVLFGITVCYKKEGRRRRARDDGYERTDGRTDAALYYTCNTRSTTMATGWIKLGISKNFMIKSVRCSIFSIIVVFPFLRILDWPIFDHLLKKT